MTGNQFAAALKHLGWSQRHFGKMTGTHPNVVSSWACDKSRIPGIVPAYLDLVKGLQSLTPKAPS